VPQGAGMIVARPDNCSDVTVKAHAVRSEF